MNLPPAGGKNYLFGWILRCSWESQTAPQGKTNKQNFAPIGVKFQNIPTFDARRKYFLCFYIGNSIQNDFVFSFHWVLYLQAFYTFACRGEILEVKIFLSTNIGWSLVSVLKPLLICFSLLLYEGRENHHTNTTREHSGLPRSVTASTVSKIAISYLSPCRSCKI